MTSNEAPFTFMNHTADLGIMVTGSNPGCLFEKAARSMMQIMIKERTAARTSPMPLSVSGEDYADLMVRWLGEILYLFEGESKVVLRTDIGFIGRFHLDAVLQTAPFNPARHEVLTEIKAVTYHQIRVAYEKDLWQARIIFDL